MKIDLHCHTKAVKVGENVGRNVSATQFKEKVNLAGVKIVAITNHNEFDRIQFEEFKKEVNNDFIILPGIEFDVMGINNDKGHIVIVYDDTDVEKFENKVKNTIENVSPNNFKINLQDLITFVNDINCIVLAHAMGKKDSLDNKSIEKLKNEITDSYRFFYEPSNYRTLGIMINHNYRVLKGTDLHNWEDYQTQEFANVKLDIDSFKQLMSFLNKDVTVIETLLNKQNKYNINIAYKTGTNENVEFYDDINVFFGTKGTGKSVSIEKVKKYFQSKSKKVSSYSPSENKDKLDKKLTILDKDKKLSTYDKYNCKAEFENINNWKNTDITQIEDYKKYVESKNQNANKSRMKIVSINNMLGSENDKLKKAFEEYKQIDNINNQIKKFNYIDYLNKDEQDTLIALLDKLKLKTQENFALKFDNEFAILYTNKTIDRFKIIVEQKTESKTIPSTAGLFRFVKNRLSLEIDIKKIIKGFEFSFESEPEFIGTLEEGKVLFKKTSVSMLAKSSKTENGFSNIKELKEQMQMLLKIDKNIYDKDLEEWHQLFKDKYDEEMSLDKFLGVTKTFVMDNKKYKPSDGEATMVILDEALQENYDIYILDEPEKSLGNNYISDVLVTKINNLAKMKKIVIIATHNANLAVRTLPYRSILKVYDNGQYKTYIGNPYTNKLINITDKNDIKLWKDESVKILEGGKEAFEERSDIYG